MNMRDRARAYVARWLSNLRGPRVIVDPAGVESEAIFTSEEGTLFASCMVEAFIAGSEASFSARLDAEAVAEAVRRFGRAADASVLERNFVDPDYLPAREALRLLIRSAWDVRAPNPDACGEHAPQTAGAAPPRDGLALLKEARRRLRAIEIKGEHAYSIGLAIGTLYAMRDELLAAGAGVAPSREEDGAPPTPSTSSDGAAPDEHGEWVIGGSGAIAPELDEPGDESGEEWRIGGGGSLDAREGAHARCRENLEAERVRYRRALGLLVDVAKVAREVIAYVDREAE